MSIALMDHQREMVEIARRHNCHLFALDCGLGKTIGILACIADQKARGYRGKTLVVAPKSVVRQAWAKDARHFPELKVVNCWHQTPNKRRGLIHTPDADVLVTSFEQFKPLADEYRKAGVTRLCVDESSKVKNHQSQISRAMHRFADGCDSVYALSGTPAPNDRTEYWSQFRCVDPKVFGPSFYAFANRYFYPQKRIIMGRERIIGYSPARSMEAEFFERLKSRSWSLTKAEALDLPEQQDIVVPVDMSDEEFEHYIKLVAGFRRRVKEGDRGVRDDAGSVGMKARQITGGGFYDEDGEYQLLQSSKIDALVDTLEQIGDRPVVIWAEFTGEIDSIAATCREQLKRSVAVIDGRSKDRDASMDAFQRGELQTLVCQPAACSHGVTLTAASYAVYYSCGYSWETHKQSRDRIHRTGQRHPCTYYYLVARDTVDERIIRALQGKRDANDEVLAMLRGEDA